MRKPVIAGNWKMNMTRSEAVVLSQNISNRANNKWDAVEVVLCPPAIDLVPVHTVLDFDRSEVRLGAQNVHWEPSGAYTGETSIPMLEEVGVTHCIIGHSERREYFAETDEGVNRKAAALLAAGMTPIVCVGESLGVRDEDTYLDYVTSQVRAALAGLDAEQVAKTIVAYEPIWAIGTGRTATPEQAQEVCSAIRACIADEFGQQAADAVRVLYGGSMNPGNVEGLMAQPDIDGGLIGGAALKHDTFIQLIEAAAKA